MRGRSRISVILVVGALIAVVVIPLAYAHEFAYIDSFPDETYSGSTGTLEWEGPWVEFGESNGPTEGVAQVTGSDCSGKCLVLEAGLVPLLSDVAVSRRADLSEASEAELYFQMRRQPGLLPEGTLQVQIRKVGQDWITLGAYNLAGSDSEQVGKIFNISGFVEHVVDIRFLITALSTQASVSIDDVEVGIEPEISTTTTTKPSTTTTVKPATTTTEPLITIPTVPPPSVPTTLPTTTTTEVRLTTSTTEAPPTTEVRDASTTSSVPRTSTTSTTTTTVLVVDSEPGPPPDPDIEASGVIVDLSPAGTARFTRAFGLSPLTSLNADFRSVVEAIQNEVVSALALGLVVAFFAVRLPKDPEELEDPKP